MNHGEKFWKFINQGEKFSNFFREVSHECKSIVNGKSELTEASII